MKVAEGLLSPLGEPVTVIVYEPIAVEAVVDIVSVFVHVGVHGLLFHDAVAPAGRPVALSVTGVVGPDWYVIFMVVFATDPRVTVTVPPVWVTV